MAEKDTSDPGEGSPSRSETQNFAVMFKSVMNEMKELKQTVASLLEPVDDGEYEDNTAESNDLEGAATPVGGKEPNAGETSKTPAPTTSGSKLLAEIVQDLDIEEKTGNDVDEGLVKLLNGLLKDKLQEDKVQTRIDKYPRPGNVEGLRTPRVNPLIWNKIPPQARTNDLKSQKSQNALVASIVAMIKATTLVLESEDADATAQNKEIMSTLTDAITLAMQCFHDMNSSRRQAMKKDLHRDYSALCNNTTVPPTSEYLFGDLSKLTKDISDANKLAKKVRPQHVRGPNRKFNMSSQRNQGPQGNRRFQPYQRPRNDFLSKGRPPRSKYKKEGEPKQT